MKAMTAQINYLHNMVGKVIKLHLPYKCIVAFKYKGKEERALLRADKIVVDGQYIPMGKSIDGYLHEGSMVGFSCHGFDQSGQDQCGYFVTMAWHHDPGAADNAKIIHGIYSARGRVSEVSHRHGVITYVDTNECEHSVLFLASKLFLFGKRLNTKQNLQSTLATDDKVQFDAVPCEKSENDSNCPWFATVVWKGQKPSIDYDMTVFPVVQTQNLTTEIKHVTELGSLRQEDHSTLLPNGLHLRSLYLLAKN
ncbi:uncharacterized protein LOC110839413 isoform X2 [Zootermopsis nevadensis]|uniref:uncharacterized protein LOC110839413 isoform X2 n=1 Tax=Zootermopsis nevadensis TaxID=136037 RepID=UPI000B8E802C|nr:uncharacterized protein LOC110839413 isoform X2 [Zootermopsis nevadensis]